MNKKNNKNRIYIILTGVVAVTLIWLSQSNRNKISEPELLLDNEVANIAANQKIDTLEGVLWPSNNEAKGNLMLTNSYATIYIRTSRDFSAFVGKSVIVSVEGVLENFTLLNIEERLIKDGFIHTP